MLTARVFLGGTDYVFLKVIENKLIHTLLEVPTENSHAKWLGPLTQKTHGVNRNFMFMEHNHTPPNIEEPLINPSVQTQPLAIIIAKIIFLSRDKEVFV